MPLPEGWFGFVEVGLACLGAAWAVIFVGRFLYAPIYYWIAAESKVTDARIKIDSLELEVAAAKRGPDCSHRLAIEGIQLLRDSDNANVEYQVRIAAVNTSETPLQFEVVDGDVSIEGVSPHFENRHSDLSVVVPPHSVRGIDFPGYPRGMIPHRNRMDGEAKVTVVYGVAGYRYSRIMSRGYLLFASIKEDTNGPVQMAARVTHEADDPYEPSSLPDNHS